MGWNKGYTIFESTVVGAYDLGVLDKNLLSVLLEPYRNTDIDSGGSKRLRSKDGKTVEEIVVFVFTGVLHRKPDDESDDDEMDIYCDRIYDDFKRITKGFGW